MPELTYAPQNPVWPPAASEDPTVKIHHVGRVGNRTESLAEIADKYQLAFADLISFNFGLKWGEPKYNEKINWFLKNKLKCTKTTPKGNFIFSGGEKLYIPPRGVSFDDRKIVATPTERRLTRYVYTEENIVEPRDPEAPNPILMAISDMIKDWMIEKSTNRKPEKPNRNVTEKNYQEIDQRSVLKTINVVRTRTDIPPSTFVRVGSYRVKMEINLVYGAGDKSAKVTVNQKTIYTEPNGNVSEIKSVDQVDQPSQYLEIDR